MFKYIAIALAVCLVTNAIEVKGREQESAENIIERPRLDGRIVGGYPINITDAPYQVALLDYGHLCGGSIIASQWILTVAHCTDGRTAAQLKIRAGSSQDETGGELLQVSKIVQHKKFNDTNADYDYSLLKLSKKIKFDDTKQPIKLPHAHDKFSDGDNCFVSGWGDTDNSSESSAWLRQVKVPIFNQEQCSVKYAQYGGVTDRMLCAGYIEGGKDACSGDSGGPLVHESGVLVGVVSWGYDCATPNYPGVYSRVTYVRDWIRRYARV